MAEEPKPALVSDYQWNYIELCRRVGEQQANKFIAEKLRQLADIVERDDYPQVFGFRLPTAEDTIMQTYELTLSYPWPG